jgi:hypothetical protein
MRAATPPSDSIEHFATIAARLDHPFADRQAVLRAAGLDDELWGQLVEHWSARLGTPEGEALAERFGDVYAAERRPHREPAPGATSEPAAPRFLSTAPPPLAAPATPAGAAWADAAPRSSPAPSASPTSRHPLAGTTDVAWQSIRAATPFVAPPPGGVHLPPAAPLPPPRVGELGSTLPVGARLPAPVLPFQGSNTPPSSPAPAAPPSEPRFRK